MRLIYSQTLSRQQPWDRETARMHMIGGTEKVLQDER
jgi:hypothetical protein